MANYWVNNSRQTGSGSNNEVHKDGCYWLSKVDDKSYLGEFSSCHGAVAAAKVKYPYTADGCRHCCPECNNE